MRNERIPDYDLAPYLARGHRLRSAAVKELFTGLARAVGRLFSGRRSATPVIHPAE